jgi:hypothetical protein
MPSARGTIHVDVPLTNFSLKYSNGAFVADRVCPRISVAKESDKYFLYGRQDFKERQDVRADKADANFINSWTIDDTPTYTCLEHSLADYVSDRERRNADAPLAPDFDCTQGLTQMILLGREKRVADLYTTAANYSTSGNTVTLSGAQQWNNASFDSTSKTNAIEVRIDTAKEAIRSAIGMNPNTIIIPSAVAKVVKRDSAVRDLIKYTDQTLLVNGDLPPVLWNMNVVMPEAIRNSAAEGQTFTGADVWGKNVVLAYMAPNPQTPRVVTFGLTFQSQARETTRWREEGKKSDAINVAEILVEKMVCEYCGYLIASCIA